MPTPGAQSRFPGLVRAAGLAMLAAGGPSLVPVYGQAIPPLASTFSPPQAPPSASSTAAAVPPAAVAAGAVVFGSDLGVIINPIKADKTADFEWIVGRLRDALRRSADPVRQAQAKSWRVLRASEPGPANSVLYLFVVDPPVKGADYTVSRILAEAFPAETEALWEKLRETFAGNMYRLTLQTLPEISVAAPLPHVTPTGSPAPPLGASPK